MGQTTAPRLRRKVGQSYSHFDGVMAEPMCGIIEASVDHEGVFTLDTSDHPVPVRIASAAPDTISPIPGHLGLPTQQAYGNGLLGIGRTKKAIYVCFI
jgi:hypothetical protein